MDSESLGRRVTFLGALTLVGFVAPDAVRAAVPDLADQCMVSPTALAQAIAGETEVGYDASFRAACPDGRAPAFPGAQGHGACATGGRGGRVLEVTSLAATREPGTLQWALDQPGPRIIVFRVSGVIDRVAEIPHGDLTIAGQTSPSGVTVRGILCDNQVYYREATCTNVVIRHLRSRPATSVERPGQGYVLDDALRLDGAQRVIVDHVSLSGAEDETVQVSRASNITVQNSALSELMGDHEYTGMLANYSSVAHPLGNLSLHHNVWNRQLARLPELNCEPNGDDGSPSNCAVRLSIEIANNLTWDQGSEIVYGGEGGLRLDFNWIGNMGFNRASYTQPLLNDAMFGFAGNRIFMSDNRYFQFPQYTNWGLAACCNDWAINPGDYAARPVPATAVATRNPHPGISYIPAAETFAYMLRYAGAFPRDPQDRRLLYPIAQRRVVTAGRWAERRTNPCDDSFATDPASGIPAAPVDSDHDGMPDDWERAHGLDPNRDDSAGFAVAAGDPLYQGMSNVEAYLHERHLALVQPLATPAVPVTAPAATVPSGRLQGLWWNPQEPGWGINFAHQGDIVFATWFTYDVTGRPTWLIAELHRGSGDVYSGRVATVSGAIFASVPFAPPPVETTIGTMTASFTDATHGAVSVTMEGRNWAKAIVPQAFGTVPVCTWGGSGNGGADLAGASNYTDLWWNVAEAGWGVNFAHQGDVVFATWFTYDTAGKPWWLIAELRKAADGAYRGTVASVVGPAFGSEPWDVARVVETPVGTATLTFADGNHASFVSKVNGVAQTKAVTRQVFVPPGTVCRS